MLKIFSIVSFVRQVKQEFMKVTWPSKQETMATTIMVFLFVFIASIFFWAIDQLLSWMVANLLGWV